MELWDAYDSNFRIIKDITLVRGEEIKEGYYHLVCDAIVRHIDGDYLLMKRAPNKTFALMWELTAGGSAFKGEDPLTCAKRELFEETGIIPNTIEELYRFKSDKTHGIYVDYLCITDIKKDSVITQENENIDYKWVNEKELLDLKEEVIRYHKPNYIDDVLLTK